MDEPFNLRAFLRNYSRHTVVRDLTIGLVFTVLSVILLLAWAYFSYSVGRQNRALSTKAAEVAEKLAVILAPPLWNIDDHLIEHITQAFEEIDQVTALFVADEKGRAIVDFRRRAEDGEEPIVIKRQILFKGSLVGEVSVSVSKSAIRRARRETLVTTAIASLSIVLALMVATQFLLQRYLTRPLGTLMKGIDRLADGDLSQRIDSFAQVDMDTISRRVNAMAEQIEQRSRQLRKSEDNYRSIFENAVEGVFQCAADGRFLNANPALAAMLGYDSPEDLIATITDLERQLSVNAGDRQRLLTLLRQGPVVNFEVQVYTKDRHMKWISLNARALASADGGIDHVEGFAQDITMRRVLEEQLRQAQKMEAVGRLAGGVAHDFNNMLTCILGYAEMSLASLPPESPLRKNIEIIYQGGEKAAVLTHQLLAFSRKQVLEIKVVNLNSVVEAIAKMLSRLIGADISFEVIIDPGIGNIKADSSQIEQVLLNLAVNARDAMPGGGRLVVETGSTHLGEDDLRVHPDVAPGHYVFLRVCDTGVGMNRQIQEKIFEPFFTTKETGKGTGLGLATVYGIIKQHKGHIELVSEPGHGTAFTVYFPQVNEPVASLPVRVPRAVRGGNETILVADDEKDVRRLIADALAPLGYRILEAADGSEALDVARSEPGRIDLLLTDIVMPGMCGKELAAEISLIRRETRMLFTSGYMDDVLDMLKVQRAYGYFVAKPLIPSVLAGKVREVLDAHWEGR